MSQHRDEDSARLNMGYLFRGISRGITHLEEETYILQAFHSPYHKAGFNTSDSEHEQAYLTRWPDTSFPLKVFATPDYGYLFNPLELKLLQQALQAVLNRVQQIDPEQFGFVLVNDRNLADITVKWRKTDGYTFGHTTPTMGRERQLKSVDMVINIPSQSATSGGVVHPQITLDIAHNMLHGLGITGHSGRAIDTGYKTWNNQQQLLTPRDIKTLRLLYRCPIGLSRQDLMLMWEEYRKTHLALPSNSSLEAILSLAEQALPTSAVVTPGFLLHKSSELSKREKTLQAFFDHCITQIRTA